MKRIKLLILPLILAGASVSPAGAQEETRPSAPNLRDVANVGAGAAGAALKPDADAPAAPQTEEERVALLRQKVLRDEDFIESEQNRDPFRSYISLFIDTKPKAVRTVPAIFDKFALEELQLIAIVSGTNSPLAMFRDPGGLGQVIKRGDYVSKVAARVSKILSDRVILELTEVVGTGESRAIEKAVLVNPEASQQ